MTPDNRPQDNQGTTSPLNAYERGLSITMRRLNSRLTEENRRKAKTDYREREAILGAQRHLAADAKRVIKSHATGRAGGTNLLTSFGLSQDGEHIFIKVPPILESETSQEVIIPIVELDHEMKAELPPLDEEAVVKNIRAAKEDVDAKYYWVRKRPGEDSDARFDVAWEGLNRRLLIALWGKSRGELPNVAVDFSENLEKVTLLLPSTADGELFEPITTNAKDLLQIDPIAANLFPDQPGDSV